VNFEGILLGDEANMKDANTQVPYRSAQPIDKRRGRSENTIIAFSFFMYKVRDYGW